MIQSIDDRAVLDAISGAQAAACARRTKSISLNGQTVNISSPYPSPTDWRDTWIYFLLLDRFNAANPPRHPWDRYCGVRQGGTFQGVQAQLGYLQNLGVKAIWLSPIQKNSPPDWNYHGYGAQNFLDLDPRFASDGTLPTAERELTALVDEAHARGIYVIVDIVLNHAAHIFDYVRPSGVVEDFADSAVMDGPLGSEPPIRWLDAAGVPRGNWQDRLDPPPQLAPDDAVWPADLQNHLFFRRRGAKLTDKPDWRGFVPGDFANMRQLTVEYDATAPGQESVPAKHGASPVLNILIRAYAYLMARYDLDGYRLDTVKYVHPKAIETFGNAMREYAMSIGKANFFTFGEVYDDEATIAKFIGRNGGSGDGFGIDAALDFPLFFKLPAIAKGNLDVSAFRSLFQDRKGQEKELLSSHGDAGLYFVTFLDNHDQHERFKHPNTPVDQVKLGLALLFTLQGVPSLYYGTEQLLQGTVDSQDQPDLNTNESVREALWGKPDAFATTAPLFTEIQTLARLRQNEPALRYGRQYFREVSGNGVDFGHSSGAGGIVAYSRVLGDREVLVAANTGEQPFTGMILLDRDLNAAGSTRNIVYSSKGATGAPSVQLLDARVYANGIASAATIAAAPVHLAPHEVQVLAPGD
ncbi:MAG TPA: alpha-amylase family glycosyl hydrolase [Paludibaculum sp.]|jgi:glycosidase